jgi:ribosomal protein S6
MEKEPKMQVYEVGYILVPTIAEENVGGEVTLLKDMLTAEGAAFIADEYPKMMELAYEMTRAIANKKQKFTNGYFGWVKFEMSREGIVAAKAALDKNESDIRFLITKTVRESTMSPKRTYTKEGAHKRKTPAKEGEPVEAINEATIDKDIEALVVE